MSEVFSKTQNRSPRFLIESLVYSAQDIGLGIDLKTNTKKRSIGKSVKLNSRTGFTGNGSKD